MLLFNRIMGLFALYSLVTGLVTRENTIIWYLDLSLVVISVMSEGVAIANRIKARKKNEA